MKTLNRDFQIGVKFGLIVGLATGFMMPFGIAAFISFIR